MSPARTVKDTSSTARVLPKSLLSARISIAFSFGNFLGPLDKQGYTLMLHLTVVDVFMFYSRHVAVVYPAAKLC